MDSNYIANLLLPKVNTKVDEIIAKYPPRSLNEGAQVTRVAPSPTGLLHIGTLYASLIAKLVASTTDGVFYLRIEDTDKKREIEGGVANIIESINKYGIIIDEGVVAADKEIGDYGPYKQRNRAEIYQTFVKQMLIDGLAYPCFCSEDKLNSVREVQENKKVRTGYYSSYSVCRHIDNETIKQNVEKGLPFVIRLKSQGNESSKVKFTDLVRGTIELLENDMDIVLLKTDGIPTYHLAHVIDDYLMHTTIASRGDEWIASTPIHLQLFSMLNIKPPKYAHISPIMKEENGNKRKLSKRKDPEAGVQYFVEKGYPTECIIEYLMSIANSDFEQWRRANNALPITDFKFSLKKLSISGALFDLVKLEDVSKNIISLYPKERVVDELLVWAKEYDAEFYILISADIQKLTAIFAIDRDKKNPRKDVAKWSDSKEFCAFMYNDLYCKFCQQPCDDWLNLTKPITSQTAGALLDKYIKIYNANDSQEIWFDKIKNMCEEFNFTSNMKEYKATPDQFVGHVGDITTLIRLAITGRRNSPDLSEILNILGEKEITTRLNNAIDYFKGEK